MGLSGRLLPLSSRVPTRAVMVVVRADYAIVRSTIPGWSRVATPRPPRVRDQQLLAAGVNLALGQLPAQMTGPARVKRSSEDRYVAKDHF
jgi:hypothetical protein